jgi:hypothetical protein
MFELFEAWRSVLHLAEWTGLSLSALAGCTAALYFGWQIPLVRKLALLAAFGTVLLWAGLIHGGSVERRDSMAERAAEKRAAEIARKQRDSNIEMAIRREYLPQLADLQRAADEREQQVKINEHQLMAQMGASANSCRIGDAALRLRQKSR